MNHIEDADILVDLTGGRETIKKYKERILQLKDENERLHKALAIATDYIEHESTRTTIGQLYDIEQALKGQQ